MKIHDLSAMAISCIGDLLRFCMMSHGIIYRNSDQICAHSVCLTWRIYSDDYTYFDTDIKLLLGGSGLRIIYVS